MTPKTFSIFAEVSLTSPKLTGDLQAFSKLTKLSKLDLHGTQISGNLKAFEKLKHLTYLDLSGSRVTGNLEDLGSSLQHLALAHTAVTGDLSTLFEKIEILQEVDVSFTQITGRISAGWGYWASNQLETLQARNSSVQLVPEGQDLMELKKHRTFHNTKSIVLASLKTLDLTNCCFATLKNPNLVSCSLGVENQHRHP